MRDDAGVRLAPGVCRVTRPGGALGVTFGVGCATRRGLAESPFDELAGAVTGRLPGVRAAERRTRTSLTAESDDDDVRPAAAAAAGGGVAAIETRVSARVSKGVEVREQPRWN